MKKLHMLAASTVTGVALAATAVSPALAWHPQGAINKSVQNVTTNGALSDANTSNAAVTAKPGDVLNYVVKVSNNGAPDANHYNDMAKTVLTDTLPAGVELVSNPSQRTISENLGTIVPGKSVTKTYKVKVTSQTDGDVLTNKACFTGNSTANDNAQQGCDVAVVKVNVPETPAAPVEKPAAPAAPVEKPATLPNTGAGDVIVPAAILTTVLGYAAYVLRQKRANA